MRSILVEDASGAQFILYEFVARGPVMSLFREQSRFQVDTGEEAEWVDKDTFVVVATGERLLRVVR